MKRTFQEGGLKEVAELLATPARSGIVLTRARLRAIGSRLELGVGVGGKARMVEGLLREAGGAGRAEELLELLAQEADAWSARCRAWEKACPPAAEVWRGWRAKSQELAGHLRRARKLARGAPRAWEGPPESR